MIDKLIFSLFKMLGKIRRLLGDKKGVTLTEAMVAVVLISLTTWGTVQTVQAGKTLRYINTSNQQIAQLREYVLGEMNIFNEYAKSKINKGSYDFAKQSRNKFLDKFPGSAGVLSSIDGKACYAITSTGSLSFVRLDIDDSIANIPQNYHMSAFGENEEDSEYGYAYPTAVCLVNAYEYIDENSSKDTVSGPVMATITSSYLLRGDSVQVSMEKIYYFNEK